MNSEAFFKVLMKARRLAWLVGVLYITGCLVLGLEFDPTNRNQWLVAATLGAVVAVTWVVYPLVRKVRTYRRNFFEERFLGQADKTLGIQRIYPNGVPRKFLRDHLSRPDIKSVKILANSARTYLIHYAAEAWPNLIASHEVKFQILIARENTEFVKEAAKMESINSTRNDPISHAIVEVKQFLLEKARKSNRRDFIEIRQFHTQIRANLIIIDDLWCCYTPHLPPISPLNSFAWELTSPETEQNKSLFRACSDYFQVLWDESEQSKVEMS